VSDRIPEPSRPGREAPRPRTGRSLLARYGRTALGAALGAVGGAAYAHYVGCHTGTCLITSSVWTAAAFFGFTGAVAAHPGPPRREASPPERGREGAAP
jgi:hypothetical protein